MMSTAVLLMFVLMVAELFAFMITNTNYDSLASSISVSTAAQESGGALRLSAHDFASQSLYSALKYLSVYESSPVLRKGNFISNLSYYTSNIMIDGVVPNASGYGENVVSADMQGLTLASYNQSMLSSLNNSIGTVEINETRPYIFQNNSYTISVSYVENLRFNTSAGMYAYSFPVNATLNLTGMPDLFYAQRGVLRNIYFASLGSQVSDAFGFPAVNGSYYNFAYGVANVLPAGSGCPALSPEVSNSVILVTQNAGTITNSGCENGFAGLITEANTLNRIPSVPYLGYAGGVNPASYIKTGEGILLYGPGLSTFNIEDLRNSVASGRYFATQFAPSYMQRASDNTYGTSSEGLLTFGGFNLETGNFNGVNSVISVSSNNLPQGNTSRSIFGWVYFTGNSLSGNYPIIGEGIPGGRDAALGVASGNLIFNEVGDNLQSGMAVSSGWQFVGFTYYEGANTVAVYLNGQQRTLNLPFIFLTSGNYIGIGGYKASYFNGTISNVQVYNTTLPGVAVSSIYSRGVEGIPISSAGLVGWWPLDGNSNDYSGQQGLVTPYGVTYRLAPSGTPSAEAASFNGMGYAYGWIGSSFGSNPVTASVWAYVNSTNNGPLYGAASPLSESTGSQAVISENSMNLYAEIGSSNGGNPLEYTENTPGWHLLTLAYSPSGSGEEVFYVDGQEVAAGTGTSGAPVYNWWITNVQGSRPIGVNGYLDGEIANVQTYSTYLTQAQVYQLYKEGVEGSPIGNAGLVNWFLLNGNLDGYVGTAGIGNSGIGAFGGATYVSFQQNPGNWQDSLALGQYPQSYPLPGVAACVNLYDCMNGTMHNLFVGDGQIGSKLYLQVGNFNGQSSFIQIQNVSSLKLSTLTISGWVYYKGIDSGTWNWLVAKQGAFGVGACTGSFNNLYPCFYNWNTDVAYTSSTQITKKVWHNLVAVISGGTETVYLDGAEVLSDPLTVYSQNTVGIQIGYGNAIGQFLNGSASNVQIYGSALSQAQIAQIYLDGITGSPLPGSGLVGWWPLDGNANDYSGSGNGGVASQNVTYGYALYADHEPANIWQALGLGNLPR